MTILNILDPIIHDNSIESYEVHSYKPYINSFNKNDEIRIPINQQDLYVLPSASTLYIEGSITVSRRVGDKNEKVSIIELVNNAVLFLFQDIRYELNGVEIDKIKNAGITTTMKSLLSMKENESKISRLWGWDIDGIKNTSGNFSVSIPLNKILGFAEDYTKIIMNCKHELVLLRSNTDLNAVKLSTNEVLEEFTIKKIVWRVPHIKVSDRERITLLRCLEKDRAISLAFRNWDLYEYPLLPRSTKHTWSIKTTSQMEKPRFVVIGLQTDRKSKGSSDMSQFDHCHLRDVKVFLNSTYFPYENLDNKFGEDRYLLIYEQYVRFQQIYFGRQSALMSLKQFKELAPLFVIDCCRQNETLKTGPVDVRVEIESDMEIPEKTTAYCLILNDCLIEYKPLSSIVKKLT